MAADRPTGDPQQSTDPILAEAIRHTLTRRRLLKGLGMGGVAVSMSGLLAACARDGEGDTAIDATPTGNDGPTIDRTPGATTSPTESPAAAQEIDQLTWSANRLVNLDAARALDPGSKMAQSIATESLLTFADDLSITTWLAASWEEVDPQTYVYRIRDDVTFQDGSPLTIEDVLFSFERHRDPDVASIVGGFGDVDSIEITSDNEITVRLARTVAFWRYAPVYLPILKQSFVEELGESFGGPGEGTVLGTGPYRVVEFRSDEYVHFERYDDYWGELPMFKELRIPIINDSQSAQLAMRAGEIDGTFFVTASEVEDWRRIDDIDVESAPGLIPAFIAWDLREEPWSDIHVRRAVAHAVNRQGIVDALLPGVATPATSIVPRHQWEGLDIPAEEVDAIYDGLRTYEFDLDLARQELEQSAFPDGFSAEIKYGNAKPHLGRAAQNLAENLAQIGVELTVTEVPISQEIADVTSHENIGMRFLSFTASLMDPANYPNFMLGSDNARPGGFNVPHYLNERVDELLQTQETTTDVQVRADALGELMRILSEDLPYLPVWWEDVVMAKADRYAYDNFHPFFFQMGSWPQRFSLA